MLPRFKKQLRKSAARDFNIRIFWSILLICSLEVSDIRVRSPGRALTVQCAGPSLVLLPSRCISF